MEETIKLLEKEVISQLPQVPYVIDQVGAALDWVKKEKESGEYLSTLKFSLNVAKYVSSISEVNFYKVHLLVASILTVIEKPLEKPEFEQFKSVSMSVENTLEKLIIPESTVNTYGCFNSTVVHLIPMAAKDEECFAISLLGILHDMEEITVGMKEADVCTPITPQDYIKVLGYALVMANVRMSNLSLLETTQDIINKIEIILNKLKF